MDLEYIIRKLLEDNYSEDEISKKISEDFGVPHDFLEVVIKEVITSTNIKNEFVKEICLYPKSGFSAGESGLGCRGHGDFLIHSIIAEICGGDESGPLSQDDGGYVSYNNDYIVVAVDGMHSRLSHQPFIAGFHVARAAIRDVLSMCASPICLFSDIHIGNDGDVGKVFDYTAGASVVSELCSVPITAGSTLRIGGDMVFGDRITGCIGAIGISEKLCSRSCVKSDDILIMTEGNGGGTIATAAIYNGRDEVVIETLEVKVISSIQKMIKADCVKKVNAMTDVTNGGIRGDISIWAEKADIGINIHSQNFLNLINPIVRKMLEDLDIDPFGVSIDSFLISTSSKYSDEVLDFFKSEGIKCDVIGEVFTGNGAYIDNKKIEVEFRESPYTPVKKVISKKSNPINYNDIIKCGRESMKKKKIIIDWIRKSF